GNAQPQVSDLRGDRSLVGARRGRHLPPRRHPVRLGDPVVLLVTRRWHGERVNDPDALGALTCCIHSLTLHTLRLKMYVSGAVLYAFASQRRGGRRDAPAAVAGRRSRQGFGTFRRLDRAIDTTSPSPPPRTSLLRAVAKPRTCSAVMDGGMDRAWGSVTTSTSAGPGRSNAPRRAPRTSFGSVTRTAGMPIALATCA